MATGEPGVLVAVDDLFFWAKIESAARHAGVRVEQALSAIQIQERLKRAVPGLIILDLNSVACEPLDTIRKIKSHPGLKNVLLVGFLSHVQIELEQAALEAGCDRVLPRSRFSATLPAILQMGSCGG
jgi:CheY-like chemotaxis protein